MKHLLQGKRRLLEIKTEATGKSLLGGEVCVPCADGGGGGDSPSVPGPCVAGFLILCQLFLCPLRDHLPTAASSHCVLSFPFPSF